jgi:hypothetical protein
VAPSDPEVNWAYYNSSEGKSYIYDGSQWHVLAQDGSEPELSITLSVEVQQADLYLKVGESITPTVEVLPENSRNKAVYWHTSEDNIVTITDDGMITAVNPGIVTVTVITKDGGFEDSVVITVPTQDEYFTFSAGEIIGYDVSGGTHVYIPESIEGEVVTTIGDRAFKELGLQYVLHPNTITTIGYSAFHGNNLTQLVLPDSVSSIGTYAYNAK